jgi:hypothetical protein
MQRSKIVGGFAALMVGSLMAMGATGVQAQPPGGGFNMPPEMKAKIAALTKWRDQHKNVSSLQTTLRGIETINKEPETQLNKQQSAKLLTIINAWKSKPDMTEDQAKDVQKQVTGMLNDKQLKRLNAPGMGGFGGGMRPGGGRPGGGGPGGPGGFKIPDPPKGSYNPLNPDSLPFEQFKPMAKKSMSDFTASLQKQAK